MNFRIIDSDKTFASGELAVSAVCDGNRSQVEAFLSKLPQSHVLVAPDKSFICHTGEGSDMKIRGLFAFANNPISDDRYIPEESEDGARFTEMTQCVIDNGLLDVNTLSDCLKKMLPAVMDYDTDCDEAVWFDYGDSLFGRRIGRVIKTVRVYYFQNEADYLAEKLALCARMDDNNGTDKHRERTLLPMLKF
jgi:hypothetical protein